MAASCLPCTWLVAFEKGRALKPLLFQSPNSRKNKLLMIQRSSNRSTFDLSSEQCYKRISRSSLAFFDHNAFSLFESKATIVRRRQSHANQVAYSATDGKNMAMSEQSEKELMKDKKNPEEKRRVVVTGLGTLTPLGDDAHSFYAKLLEGVSGITEIEGFDCSDLPTRIAGEIKTLSTDGLVAPKHAKRADKHLIYALIASKKALADGGITEQVSGQLDKSRCGVLIGSAMGGMHVSGSLICTPSHHIESLSKASEKDGLISVLMNKSVQQVLKDAIAALKISYKKMSPFSVPYSLTNMASAVIAMDLEWMGPNYAISSTCATSNYCIINAANHIIKGDADMMLCGGSDGVIIPEGIAGFLACSTLSQRKIDPTKASRPWDSDRDGFVMGEGAGVLLLEELQHAKRRGANIYAEFLGGSFIFDAYRLSEPHFDGWGVVACMEKALAHSGVTREDVNYINAHATSTRAGDCREFKAVMHCFGKNPELRMNSTKSMTGDLLGAAGGVEAIATVKAIQTGWIHPNINLENPDKDVDTRVLVGSKKERLDIKVAMSNSFGFGGHNSSILFTLNN